MWDSCHSSSFLSFCSAPPRATSATPPPPAARPSAKPPPRPKPPPPPRVRVRVRVPQVRRLHRRPWGQIPPTPFRIVILSVVQTPFRIVILSVVRRPRRTQSKSLRLPLTQPPTHALRPNPPNRPKESTPTRKRTSSNGPPPAPTTRPSIALARNPSPTTTSSLPSTPNGAFAPSGQSKPIPTGTEPPYQPTPSTHPLLGTPRLQPRVSLQPHKRKGL